MRFAVPFKMSLLLLSALDLLATPTDEISTLSAWFGERVGFEPTVRLPVQRFSSSKVLVTACAAQ
jgi:hypothetical protein